MRIRSKFNIVFIIIFSISFICFNIVVNIYFNEYINNFIKNDMNKVYESSYRISKYYYNIKGLYANEENFYENIPNISMNISEENECNINVYDNKLKEIYKYENGQYMYTKNESIDNLLKYANDNFAVVHIISEKENDNIFGKVAFPVYLNNYNLGIMILTKNYTEFYNGLLMFVNILKILTVIIFLIMVIASYFLCNKIVAPLFELKKAFKRVEEGIYNAPLIVNTNDEINDLANGFNEMKGKINKQIKIIKEEKDKILALENSKTEFFNNVTHELKTPLTAISGYTQILSEDDFNDEEFRKFALERIYKESNRMNKMVKSLIDISKNNSYIGECEFKKIKLSQCIKEIVEDLLIKAKKYGVLIEYTLDDVTFNCAIEDIKTLVLNVLDNAIKYSINDSKIEVKLKKTTIGFKLIVENISDEHIDKQNIEKIFHPFYRVNVNKSRKEDGNGLGLYICYKIVEKYNGHIKFNCYDNKVKVEVKI